VEVNWMLLLVALGVGLLVGITGVGAGALMTPLLVGVFGIPITTAVATDLLFATITKVVGVGLHNRLGNIDWRVAARLWAGSIPGVLVGIALLIIFAAQSITQWLTWPLAILVLATAFTLGRRALQKTPRESPDQDPITRGRTGVKKALSISGGFGIGAAVALTSVGAGALGMALLVKLSPPNTKPQHLVGTDLVHAIPIALIAGIAYGSAGLVDWTLLVTLLFGSIPGVLLGSILSPKLPPAPLNGLLALVLAAAAMLVLFR